MVSMRHMRGVRITVFLAVILPVAAMLTATSAASKEEGKAAAPQVQQRPAEVWSDASGIWVRSGSANRPLNAANTDNHWSGRQSFSASENLTKPFMTIYGSGQTEVEANPLFILNTIKNTPKALVQNILNVTTCHGNNRTFVGCSAGYFAAGDDSTVTAANKGVLYALALSTRPHVTRGDGSPNDDANGLVVSNDGIASGTEAIYLGRNKSVANDWLAGIGVDANAVSGMYLTGTYTYGITFAHGPLAQFAKGGGVMLVPRPARGTTPLVSIGSDAFNPANNATLAAIDVKGALVVPTSLHLCGETTAADCVGKNAPLVVESHNGSAVTLTDASASHVFELAIGAKSGNLVVGRSVGTGVVAFTPPVSAPSLQLTPTTFAALPQCRLEQAGTMAFITDASARIANWHQEVTRGGGVNRAFLTCDGSGWFAFSY
jgi:hypothetical protein